MRKTIFVLLALLCALNIQAITPAQGLIQRLLKIQKKGYMYGHQDDPFYGITWEWEFGRSDTYDLVGDYPAVMGFDLGGLEVGDRKNLDSVPFVRIREAIIAQHERGGIVTISWHPRNPLLGTTAWIGNDTTAYNEAVAALKKVRREDLISQIDDPKMTVRACLPGGKVHDKYMLWLSRLAEFMKTLTDKKGNPVPFIFRPFHENSGSWFWWGDANCSAEDYLALWNMTQDYINKESRASVAGKESGADIVWSYSPSYGGASWTEAQFMSRYPGDERIDLLGIDAYQWGAEADFRRDLDHALSLTAKIAAEHSKLLALTECGYVNSPDATWWTRVVKPIIEKYPVSYLLPWRNYKKEHFGASPDAATADDFRQWAKEKQFMFVNDIKKIR